jgi:hypothetical protein
VKLPAHRAGLPGKVISFYIVPLDPAYKAGLAGHSPVKNDFLRCEPKPYIERNERAWKNFSQIRKL